MSFKALATKDGSPTLQLCTEGESTSSELMHHSGGAFAETQYIYGEALRLGFSQGLSRVVSVGIGLGYNEILSAQEALKSGVFDLRLESFESESLLRENFLKFILQNEGAVYHQMAQYFEDFVPTQSRLVEMLQNKAWSVREALTPESLPLICPQIALYDAFSSKTTPELWEKEFLINFLKTCDENTIFTTYACRSTLKEALKEQGFEVQIRPGFQGKRNCTLAVRGEIKFLD